MRLVSTHPLIDGPLIIPAATEQLQTVQRMADILVAEGTYRVRRDAVRSLLRHGFHHRRVARYAPDAMALSIQPDVAREMSSNG